MRTYLFFTFILFCISNSKLSAQNYSTLASGAWNNTTNVWSLNGITPCGCYPGTTLNADTLIINHPIDLTSNISALASSQIQINPNGSLSNLLFNLEITASNLISYGSITVKGLTIGIGGEVNSVSCTLMIEGAIDVYGSFTSDFSNITVINGNIRVYSTGAFSLLNQSRMHFIKGNIVNDYNVTVEFGSCISFDRGNITNELYGTFSGGGTLITSNGTVKNYGIWSPSLVHCSSGTDVGLINLDNCPLANDICKFAPLPTELVSFTGVKSEDKSSLNWVTASETNSDYFILSKSLDGVSWEIIENIKAKESSIEISEYNFTDYNKNGLITYYKLELIDKNGVSVFSNMISVLNNSINEFLIFPNPTTDNVTVQLQKNHSFTTLIVFDHTGRVLNQYKICGSIVTLVQLPIQKGYYFIKAVGESDHMTQTLVKM